MIITFDEYRIFDHLLEKRRALKHPASSILGWVRVFLNRELVFEGENLVVAQGREFVAQKLFNTVSTGSGNRPNLRPYTVSHFAIGSGGATVNNDQVLLNGPYVCDTGLYQPISLGVSGYLNEPSGYDAGDGIHHFRQAVKPIATHGSVVLESESYSDGSTCTYYTKVKSTCVIPAGEPAVLQEGQAVEVSEAGLYLVYDTTAKLFAHICFAPKWLEKESSMSIVWYTLC